MSDYTELLTGQRPEGKELKYLSCFNLSEWQKEKLLEKCVWIAFAPYQQHIIAVVALNTEDADDIAEVVEREKVIALREGDI